ncbi:hypothetical protein BN2475_450084 [Paraburkholderia ribeironis]|uniref:Uncharacterized protein n=1 Tax=Paraburkholderia ribeironis TaxID=1247936 RepID=A0A1N7S8W9_9BURK|nr:hypothetical protein BN2475_450084 [Paraburkholderia ribeironis]
MHNSVNSLIRDDFPVHRSESFADPGRHGTTPPRPVNGVAGPPRQLDIGAAIAFSLAKVDNSKIRPRGTGATTCAASVSSRSICRHDACLAATMGARCTLALTAPVTYFELTNSFV